MAARSGEHVALTTYVQDDQRSRTVLTGPKDDVLSRWDAGVAAAAPLNALDLDYPNYGFRMDGTTVNSNSAYRTLGEVMGLPVRDFPGVVEPGIESHMTSPDRIEALRVKGRPVIDAPSRREGDRYVPLQDGGLPLPPLPKADLLGQTTSAVGRLEASLGRMPDESSDRIAFNLAAVAPREGFERVDHVVLGVATDRLRAGEHVFVVQGDLHAPDNRVAHMRSAEATLPPPADAIACLQQPPGPRCPRRASRQPSTDLRRRGSPGPEAVRSRFRLACAHPSGFRPAAGING